MKRTGSKALSDTNSPTDVDSDSSEDVGENKSFDKQIHSDLATLSAAKPKSTLHSYQLLEYRLTTFSPSLTKFEELSF